RVRPASAIDAPMSVNICRRSKPVSIGTRNSRARCSPKSSVRAISSRLLQYSRPRSSSSFDRTAAMSTLSALFTNHKFKIQNSSVARRTVGQLERGAKPVTLRERRAALERFSRRHVAHREDLIPGPQVRLRVAVAVHAPGHVEGRVLRDERHPIDPPVAGLTADALGDMDRVIEVDEVGQVVDLDPLDGAVGAEALADGLELGRLVP